MRKETMKNVCLHIPVVMRSTLNKLPLIELNRVYHIKPTKENTHPLVILVKRYLVSLDLILILAHSVKSDSFSLSLCLKKKSPLVVPFAPCAKMQYHSLL